MQFAASTVQTDLTAAQICELEEQAILRPEVMSTGNGPITIASSEPVNVHVDNACDSEFQRAESRDTFGKTSDQQDSYKEYCQRVQALSQDAFDHNFLAKALGSPMQSTPGKTALPTSNPASYREMAGYHTTRDAVKDRFLSLGTG